jgi:hypothetical protein
MENCKNRISAGVAVVRMLLQSLSSSIFFHITVVMMTIDQNRRTAILSIPSLKKTIRADLFRFCKNNIE